MKFSKYHALGNDYLVIDPKYFSQKISSTEIKALCNRHYGVGSDGVLFGPLKSENCDFSLRIYNPDASEAEVSGNGLRIFCRYLWDCGIVGEAQFSIETKGGIYLATVHESGGFVSIEMGRVRFTHDANSFPALEPEKIYTSDRTFTCYRASVGNPHCVIPVDDLSPQLPNKYGEEIERNPKFRNRTNVQFVKIIDRNTVQIEIWERGAGYTLASGSSSTSAAAVAFALGFCDPEISVHMPGGIIEIAITDDFYTTMKGPVCKIADGELCDEAIKSF